MQSFFGNELIMQYGFKDYMNSLIHRDHAYGLLAENAASSLENEGKVTLLPARVTAVHKERYEIVTEFGIAYARLKSSIYFGNGDEAGLGERIANGFMTDAGDSLLEPSMAFPTTGDFVLIHHNPIGDSLIYGTLKRKTFFSRLDPTPGRGEQAVAANFDSVFILSSLNHDFNLRRMERYLTLAWQSAAVPVIVLTKADLVEDYAESLRAVERLATGVEVFAVSSVTGEGLEQLENYLKPGKTIVFLGSSGVGKSSLLNALAGETIMETNAIRDDDSKGRHTTTHRQLILLKSGVMIIDTPGMRTLGMWDVSTGLGEAFGDVETFLGTCRFSDCKHQKEPGCAIQAALADGRLSRERWNSFLKLMREARYTNKKANALQAKTKHNKAKAMMRKKKRS